ncbi:GIY-YIG nuclease family protein [bacterium]|nr:GIY-YIG nuclease family protein [bacterium]MCD6283223.1 GIY-YIG nuclease family protein [bacterium]
MVTLYVLKSLVDGKRYVGVTNNLKRRLAEHRRLNTKAGQLLGKFELLHSEQFEDYAKARRRERFLKGGHGRAWLDRLEKSMGPARHA